MSPLQEAVDQLRRAHGVHGVSMAWCDGSSEGQRFQTLCSGWFDYARRKKVTEATRFQYASLSKTLAAAMVLSYFQEHSLDVDTSAIELLKIKGISSKSDNNNDNNRRPVITGSFANDVTVRHLLNHSSQLGMHYVHGFESSQPMPSIEQLISSEGGYFAAVAHQKPGVQFQYSGGGYLILEYLIKQLTNQSIEAFSKPYLSAWDIHEPLFTHQNSPDYALGYRDDGKGIQNGHLNFPLFAAGGSGSALSLAKFLAHLTPPTKNLHPEVCKRMLESSDGGSQRFMGANIGLGVFVANAGPNQFILHQGANDGFRCLYIACTKGPDAAKSLVILANGDNNAVPLLAALARCIMDANSWQGLAAPTKTRFDAKVHKAEEIVNQGLKALLFDDFIVSD